MDCACLRNLNFQYKTLKIYGHAGGHEAGLAPGDELGPVWQKKTHAVTNTMSGASMANWLDFSGQREES